MSYCGRLKVPLQTSDDWSTKYFRLACRALWWAIASWSAEIEWVKASLVKFRLLEELSKVSAEAILYAREVISFLISAILSASFWLYLSRFWGS